MLALYGHPFSSYTWKALIALYAQDIPFAFRMVGPDHAHHAAVVQHAGPLGKFPVLEDGAKLVNEAGQTMEEVVTNFQKLSALVTEIAEASQEQSGGIEQVTQRIDGPECCILHLLCGVCRLIAHPVILEPQPTDAIGVCRRGGRPADRPGDRPHRDARPRRRRRTRGSLTVSGYSPTG